MAETNKTEKATPKKKKDERRKGNAFQSRDVVSVAVLLIGFVLVTRIGHFVVRQLQGFYLSQLDKAASLHQLTAAGSMTILKEALLVFFLCTIPVLLALMLTAVIMTGVQTRFLVSSDLLKFKYSRISLLGGIKRMLSVRSLVQLVKSLLKAIVIFTAIYSSLKGILAVTPDILNSSIEANIAFLIDQILSMVYKICLLFVGIAALDFAYQKYDYEKKLRMTKQEVKDEYKQIEGDPFIKGKIKEKQRKISMNRMIQQVPKADVIIRNPTHYAVALRYDINKDPAPVVLAKGQDSLALRIVQIGEKNHVFITENKPLARGLYETAEVNQYIPAELYQAVAEVLAWVYEKNQYSI